MSARSKPVPMEVRNQVPITVETHYEFLHHLQSALLLALREQGLFSLMQHRYAQERLNQQRRERARCKQEGP